MGIGTLRFWIELTLFVVMANVSRSSLGQDTAGVTAKLVTSPFYENLRSEVPVSGGDIVGLIVADPSGPSPISKLWVMYTGEAETLVCVEMASANGLYLASNTYELPAVAPQTYVEIPVPTRYRKLFHDLTTQSLAVSVHQGACSAKNKTLLLAANGPSFPAATQNRLQALVQSSRSKASLLVGESPVAISACVPMKQDHVPAFDAICEFPLPNSTQERTRLQLETCSFGECDRSSPIYLIR